MCSILGPSFVDESPNALDLFFGNNLRHFIAMRNKNFEGAFQGEARFIHSPLLVPGILFLIVTAVRKPPIPWVVPIVEIPSAFGYVFPIAQHKKGLFDLAVLS